MPASDVVATRPATAAPEGALQGALPGALRLTPLHPVIGARVEGLDLRQKLTPDQAAAIERAMDRFAVLVFPDQKLDDEQQSAFGCHFGEIEGVPTLIDQERRRLANQRINDISNLGADGKLLPADDRRRMFNLGNMLWHSDSSFKATPAKYSLLSARVIRRAGGNTEFADMRAAWDALDAETRALVRDLVT